MLSSSADQTKLLIDAGADVNAVNNEGISVLMFSQYPGQKQLLIEAGADE